MIRPCVCCLKRTAVEKLEAGYCRSCIRAGMKEVGDDFLKSLK